MKSTLKLVLDAVKIAIDSRIPTSEQAIELGVDMELIEPPVGNDGYVFTDSDGTIYVN